MHLKCGTGNCKDQNPLSDFPIGSNCCYDPIPSKMKKRLFYEIIAIRYRDGRLEVLAFEILEAKRHPIACF